MDMIPQTRTRRVLATTRFFELIEEDIEDRDGKPYPYFTIASTWDAVVVVPVLPDGRMVVERIYRHPYRSWLLEFPAGGINQGESPVAAAARELLEETGWAAHRLTPLTCFEALPGLLRMRLHVVLAEDLTPTGSMVHEPAEFIEVVELTLNQVWAAARTTPASSFLTYGLLAYHARSELSGP